MFALLLAAAVAAEPAKESISVDVVGTLKTGIVAIGAETTGATITANGVTWEVDTGDNAELRETAAKLNGKVVKLSGTLERRKGVEISERWIVHVKSVQAAEGEKRELEGAAEKPNPGFEVTPDKKDSRLGIMLEQGELIVDVVSASGIGSAKLKRLGDSWPTGVHVRLHLKGLEQFRAANADVAAEWAVSSSEKNSVMTLRKNKVESIVKPEAKDYTQAKFIGPDPNDPSDKGYFEVRLPAMLFEKNPQEISLGWIDFYR